ncbi:DegQ family serine endoprotease [Bordetella sp. FB-8]|uniref:DegQ family serine endoprotease n=1 Tax=Bordetella sp. FB-8 TaxID=1159870 RepID=UPI0003784E3A|nr:DegQ family serine endoprotease [Bordetella sp. FB-8]
MYFTSVSIPLTRRVAAFAAATVLSLAGIAPVQAAEQHAAAATTAATPAPLVNLPDFTPIVEKADPAVVNIRTTATVSLHGGPGGMDPSDLFRFFFGPDSQGQGGAQPGQGQRKAPKTQPAPQERVVPQGVGSGFFISSDGYVLTNYHVIDDATDIYVTLNDGREFKAKVVGSDKQTDVALLKINAKGMATLPIGDSDKIKKGQWVLAIGSPFGLDSTVTAGIISAINRDTGDYLPFIQTDVAVNPGNSGGPLINMQGEVIGINSQIISRSGGFMGISLAIPIDDVMRVVNQLRTSGKVTRSRIGVQISEVSDDVAKALGLPKAEGAMVGSVQPKSPAETAGVQPGDVITAFNGAPVKRWSDLPRMVGDLKPGTTAALQVWRKGKSIKLEVKVIEIQAAKQSGADSQSGDQGKKEPSTDNLLGLGVVDVPADQLNKLSIKGGALVREVTGLSADAGIQPGDIVLAINNTDIADAAAFAKVVAKLDKHKVVGVLVRRGGQVQWVAIQPEK